MVVTLEEENVALRERVARLETAMHDAGKCPRCQLTRMECADVIAEFEVERKSSANRS